MKMEGITRASFSMIRNTVKESTHGQMVRNMTVAGRMANNMVKPTSSVQKDSKDRDSGKTVSESDGLVVLHLVTTVKNTSVEG